jgi:hypothetical protein
MNTTIHTTTDTATTSTNIPEHLEGQRLVHDTTATAGEAHRRAGRRTLTRALASIVVVAGTLASVAAIDTGSAAAMEIGPGSIAFGGLSSANVSCNADHNQVRVNITAAVQTGYFNGQWIAYRYYSTDGRTALWTSWQQKAVHYNGYNPSTLIDQTFNVSDGGDHRIFVEIMWWNGVQWTNYQGYWAQRGQAGYYYTSWNGFCYT